MFGRWIKLLAALTFISIAVGIIFDSIKSKHRGVADMCDTYVKGQTSDWVPEDDEYYNDNCNLAVPYSSISIEIRERNEYVEKSDFGIILGLALLGLIFISFVTKWLFTGKVR